MHIALIAADYQPAAVPCGVGDYTRCLRRALGALGHRTLVVTSARTRSGEPDVHRVSGRWGSRDTLKARRILRDARVEVVILQYTPEQYGYGPSLKLLPLLLCFGPAPPVSVTTYHTLVGGRWISKAYAALLAAASRGLISTNPELSDLVRRRLPRWAWKLCEIPIGANIPAPRLEPSRARALLRRRLGLEPGAAVLGTFGFPAPGKGLETLLRSLSRLGGPSAAHLVCIGETRQGDRAYQMGLMHLGEELGLMDRVHWIGGLPEQQVADLLAGVDAYVVPYDEGSSLRRGTLLAGIRVGVPIVTTAPRHPDPTLRPGETILAVPPRSPEALADALRALLADEGLQAHLRHGLLDVQPRFEWLAIAKAHVQFLEAQVLSGGRPL
jgi:glycosyltransferase involved in cell wall biosynthesis